MTITLLLSPVGPSLVLALGGLLLLLLSRTVRARSRWEPTAALVSVAAGALQLFVMRASVGRPPGLGASNVDVRWVWQPLTVAGSALEWHLERWNWLAALLVLLVTSAALALQDYDAREPYGIPRSVRTLWLSAGALGFVFSNNVVTLATCWLVLDGLLAFRLWPGERPEPAGRVWAFSSLGALGLLAALVLLGEANVRSTLVSGPISGVPLALLWLVALVRAGIYPFHYWLATPVLMDAGDRATLSLIVPTTGLWLMARVQQLGGPGWLHGVEWTALGAVALLGTALAAWTSDDQENAWRWVAANRASLALVTLSLTEVTGPQALVWPAVTFALGGALLAVGQVARVRWAWPLPIWLGALVTWGFPGTPGFLARSTVFLPDRSGLLVVLFGVITVADIVLVAVLWQMARGQSLPAAERPAGSSGIPRRSLVQLTAAAAILFVPLLIWGLLPRQLALLAGLPVGEPTLGSLWQGLFEARRSVWVAMVVAGAAGIGLGIQHETIFSGMRGWQRGISNLVSLEWLYRAAGAGLAALGSGFQYFARVGEGEGYVGWLALGALLLWVLLRA